MQAATQGERAPRPSATVALVRDAAQGGIEVLLLERRTSNDHTSGAWVFPGGVLEARDAAAEVFCDITDAQASARLGIDSGGIAFHAAAIRECFEECGVLLAHTREARAPELREADRHGDFWALCERERLLLEAGALHAIGHWLTPRGRAKRFDTRFFVAVAPPSHEAQPDGREVLRHAWLAPASALQGEFGAQLMTPTRATLQALAKFERVADVIAWAKSLGPATRIEPRLARNAAGLCTIVPGHPAFAEVGKLDPDGAGHVACEPVPDVPVSLAETLTRVTDASGRNRYVVGERVIASFDAPVLLKTERIVVARDASQLDDELRRAADWLAPERGFLVDLRDGRAR